MIKKVQMTPEEMRDHAMALAHAFKVVLDLREDLPPDLAVATWVTHPTIGEVRVVIAPSITNDTSYAVVLHEMGHHLSALGCVRKDLNAKEPQPGCHARDRHRWFGYRLLEEEAAWEWAEHYSLCWTTGMEQVKLLCFATYEIARREIR